MDLDTGCNLHDFEANFKIYHELMRHKVHDVLLVFTSYDAFIIEEDGSLASRVVSEYHGLNLSHPPRLSRVATGREALDLYESYRPDFVTLDITMPQLNGIEALTLMMHAYPDAKVVIVSAVGQKRMVFQAIAQGAKDFIIKPFEPERVLIAIDRLFE